MTSKYLIFKGLARNMLYKNDRHVEANLFNNDEVAYLYIRALHLHSPCRGKTPVHHSHASQQQDRARGAACHPLVTTLTQAIKPRNLKTLPACARQTIVQTQESYNREP